MDRVILAGLALVLAQVAFRWWALSGSWFYFDDLAFLSRGMHNDLTWDYLSGAYSGHLMPGGFAVIWVLTRVAVYDWSAWGGLMLLLNALAGLGMLRLLASMFGRRPVILVPLALYLFYIFTVPAGIWFAAGINQLPLQVALVFGLHAHLAYLRTRRWPHLVATLLWTVFGLAFYEKSVLLFGIYALVALCWFSTGNTPQRLSRLWADYRTGILAHGLVAVPYVVFYVKYGLNFGTEDATNRLMSSVAYNLVGQALATGAIGGPFHWRVVFVGSLAEPGQLAIFASWAALGGLVYYAYRTRTISRRAWTLIGFTVMANIVLLASARANLVGPDIALEYRYQTESAALLVLSGSLALLPLVGALEVNRTRPDVSLAHERKGVVAALTLAVVAASVYSTVRYVHVWQVNNPTKGYYDAFRSSLADADQKPVPLVDLGLPQDLLWAFGFPENTYSHVFKNLSDETTYPTWAVDKLYVPDDTGNLALVSVPATRAMVPGEGCGYVLKSRETRIPLNGPVVGGGWWVRMGYGSPVDLDVEITAGDSHHSVTLPRGFHDLYFEANGTFDEITVSALPPKSGACVTQLFLGLPEPWKVPS